MARIVKWYGNQILKDIGKQNTKLVRCIAHTIARKAKQKCPVKTGTLRRSIRAVVSKDIRQRSIRGVLGKDKAEVHAGGDVGCAPGVGTPVEYAAFVEFGTAKMAAQPFLRPAVEAFSASDLENCMKKIKGE